MGVGTGEAGSGKGEEMGEGETEEGLGSSEGGGEGEGEGLSCSTIHLCSPDPVSVAVKDNLSTEQEAGALRKRRHPGAELCK